MSHSELLFATALSLAAASGCSLVEPTSCTDDYRFHTIDVTREVATTDDATALVVEGCLEDQCKTAVPEASGRIDFDVQLGDSGPFEGSVGAGSDAGKQRVTVRFSVGEKTANATSALVLRIKRGDATLLDETATVQWSDDDCHPTPASTKL
jgi:hypothetical protein